MFGKKRSHKTTYGLIGLGRFGAALARELYESGADMIILDKDADKVALARDMTDNAFIVNSLDKKTLLETGINNVDVAIVCIGEQIDTSILTTLNLVTMGIPKVISKASSAEHGEILEKLGAEVVYPERDMGVRLAHRLETSQTLDFVQLSEKINISKLIVPSVAIGKSVIEVNLRGNFGLNIVAIEKGNTVVESVHPDYVFSNGDILILSGSKDGFAKFSDWANK